MGKNTEHHLYEGYTTLKGWNAKAPKLSKHQEKYFELEMKRVHFRSGMRILELGFGEGLFLDWAKESGAEVAGVEIIEELTVEIKERHPHVFFGTLPSLVAKKAIKGTFDLIVAFDVFEHLSKDELVEHFQAFGQLLNKGGQVFARFPNGQSPFSAFYQNGDLTHKSALNSFSMKQVGVMTDFELEGAYNPARVNQGRFLKRVATKGLFLGRDVVELALGTLYYFQRIPMEPNLVVVFHKK